MRVRLVAARGSARTSTIRSATRLWSVCGCRASIADQRSASSMTLAPPGSREPAVGTSTSPRLSTGIRSRSTFVNVPASARPYAGTRRSPTRTKRGARRTTPSASGEASVCPMPFACWANPGSDPVSGRYGARRWDAPDSGGHERCCGSAAPALSRAVGVRPSSDSSAIGSTTFSAWAIAWLRSASLAAPPRPGALGCSSEASRPMTAAPACDRLVTSRASAARSANRDSLARSRTTTIAGRPARSRAGSRSYRDHSNAVTAPPEAATPVATAVAASPITAASATVFIVASGLRDEPARVGRTRRRPRSPEGAAGLEPALRPPRS